ncbi:MAG: hypothetical protein GF353_11095 [Candidatus Lokiarchaeota archaeon]|nr:hypothetical protein [Candidatus Lokiarchaeota archaeon]
MKKVKKYKCKIYLVFMKKFTLIVFLLILSTGCTKQEQDQNKEVLSDNSQSEINTDRREIEEEAEKIDQSNNTESVEFEKAPVIVDDLESGSIIQSPLTIKGEALGIWFFEGDFPIKLVNDKDEIIVESYATAKGEWMTEEYVFFEAKLEFDPGDAQTGKLIFEKDNPSGRGENTKSFEIMVKFK